jgi:hypothetical protein
MSKEREELEAKLRVCEEYFEAIIMRAMVHCGILVASPSRQASSISHAEAMRNQVLDMIEKEADS